MALIVKRETNKHVGYGVNAFDHISVQIKFDLSLNDSIQSSAEHGVNITSPRSPPQQQMKVVKQLNNSICLHVDITDIKIIIKTLGHEIACI